MKEEKDLKRAVKQWEDNQFTEASRERPLRPNSELTGGALPVKPLYTPIDVRTDDKIEAKDYMEKLGFPGEYPFTRGIHPTMYRGKLWTMRQYAGFGSPEETNLRFRELLNRGQTGLSVAFDLPTQLGLDSDDPMAEGEVGRTGVCIDSLADMERLFEGIQLSDVSTSMTINAPAACLLAMYQAIAEKQNVQPNQLRGTVQNDILKEYTSRNTYIFPPKPSLRLTADIIEYCSKLLPKWNSISIGGYHIREAGATAIQEVAFTFANAIAYIEETLSRGLSIDDFGPRLSFFFSANTDLLEEIAKFRAARRLWAKIVRDRFVAKDRRTMMLRFHVHTAGCTLSAKDTDNNIARVTLSALAAVLGGTQSLHTCSKDEALSLPSEKAATTALRTQQIIAHESGVTATIDPLGGSYYVESLTDRIEEGVDAYLRQIDAKGGAVSAIEEGYIQSEIEASAFHYQQQIETGERILVGVNELISDEKMEIPEYKFDSKSEEEQKRGLAELRNERDNAAVGKLLDKLKGQAATKENLMPTILQSVKVYATVGEICQSLRSVFGEYKAGA